MRKIFDLDNLAFGKTNVKQYLKYLDKINTVLYITMQQNKIGTHTKPDYIPFIKDFYAMVKNLNIIMYNMPIEVGINNVLFKGTMHFVCKNKNSADICFVIKNFDDINSLYLNVYAEWFYREFSFYPSIKLYGSKNGKIKMLKPDIGLLENINADNFR